jgi:hypothetical protein
MSVTSQQVSKRGTAQALRAAPGVKAKVRGFAGNHTLMKRMNVEESSPRQVGENPPRPLSEISQPFLQRKCACGNGLGVDCEECKRPEGRELQRNMQTKLAVSEPGDRYEQEADRVADQVLAAPAHAAIEVAAPHIQRFAGTTTGHTQQSPASVDRVLASRGRPLDTALRQDMESRFNHDFSAVRVHSGTGAELSAAEVNAQAYTVGHDIVFGPGQFAPGTVQGRRLVAHELTHVVQQSGGSGARIVRRSFAACQKLIDKEKGLGLVSGTLVHKIIAADFQKKVKGARTNLGIPGASAGPQRTEGICGKPSPVIDPQQLGNMDPKAGVGFPDLARVKGKILQVAEIKPAAHGCLIDGETQFARYILEGNAPDENQAQWRASMGFKVVSPLPGSVYPDRLLQISIPEGAAVVETGWCTPGLLAYAVTLKSSRGKPAREPGLEPVRVPAPARQPSLVPVRVKGVDPYFEDDADQLPYLEKPPGRIFVVAVEDGIYRDTIAERTRRHHEQTLRAMRVDPRGVPMFQVSAPLVGIAVVAGAIQIGLLVLLVAPAIPSLATAAAGAVVPAGIRWGVVQLSKVAAAEIVILLMSEGISEAEAAKAVEPLVDKRIAATADVTGNSELENAQPGQEISVEGQSFRVIMLLTTQDYEE